MISLARTCLPPPTPPQALLYFLGHKREELGDPQAPDPARFEWSAARRLLAPEALLPELDAHAPTLPEPGAKPPPRSLGYMQPPALRETLASLTLEELDTLNPALGALHIWLTAALDEQVRVGGEGSSCVDTSCGSKPACIPQDARIAQRARLAEEAAAAAAAKAAAEEEAAAAAAAAEAEAAAAAAAEAASAAGAAAEGEGEGAGEEEEQE